MMHRAVASSRASIAPPIVSDVLRGPGQSLESGQRRQLEQRLGHDFSRVRVHTGEQAGISAQAVAADAYTVGRHIVFAPGRFAPGTTEGRHLLVHELAHVAQQETSGDAHSGSPIIVGPPRDDCEREAEHVAAHAANGSVTGASLTADATSVRAQRQPVGESVEWSIDPSGIPEPTGIQVLDTFDVDRGKGRKSWDLDRLTIAIGTALKRSKTAKIDVMAYYDSASDMKRGSAGAARAAALRRGEIVRKALIQWVPVPPGRITVTPIDRSMVGAEGTAKRQVSVVLVPSPGAWRAGLPSAPPTAAPATQEESTLGEDIVANVKAFFGDGARVDIEGQNISVAITGVKAELKRWVGGTVEGKIGSFGSVQVLTQVGNWHFAAQVTPYSGAWRVTLSFPRETWTPDATRIQAILTKGVAAIDALRAAGTDPTTHEALKAGDLETLKERFVPHIDPIKHAIEAGMGLREAVEAEMEAKGAKQKGPRVSAGIEIGSGWGPGAPEPPPGVKRPEGYEGIHARGVLTIVF